MIVIGHGEGRNNQSPNFYSVFGSFLVKERKGRERKGQEKKRMEEKGKKP